MSPPYPSPSSGPGLGSGRTSVALFSGGRGGASIARRLLRIPGVELSLLINGYDNGHSTGALRRYLPGMLGPSDFRKNLLLHLDGGDPRQAALRSVLEHRLPAGSTRDDLAGLVDRLIRGRTFGTLPPEVRTPIVRDLTVFLRHLDGRPHGLSLSDCALGNLVFAGAYLRLGGDFNAAVGSCARTFGSPARLVNVTGGENAFLVALKEDGRLLADEADIVAPQDAAAITDLFLLREPVVPESRTALQAQPAERLRRTLDRARAGISLNPEARDALRHADLIVYGPGTPHSSLLPSYLTPGLADAIAANRAAAKVFVVNIRDDHDVRGLGASDLVDRTLAYLGDPFNERRTVTHVLCHRTAAPAGVTGGGRAGVRWITGDLEDPGRPGAHCGRRTVSALTGIAAEASLVGAG
ncbi:gluconeogenesis factor [Planomonospora sphaerica]|uniref:Gluconeogenesis factor n=1 Tax=Planomonospora sphaerica TaxID=161355 RepID=A0A161LMW6_9ACTN|nr:2-phospho-L-lactate transferase CofD family protein [Planomonospora sphaerica]GAT70577.1 gluconeogenesis factor [Planomonospora sphaerica]